MFCTQCGKRIDDPRARFCPECGAELPQTAVSVPQADIPAGNYAPGTAYAPQSSAYAPQSTLHTPRSSPYAPQNNAGIPQNAAYAPQKTDKGGFFKGIVGKLKGMSKTAKIIAAACAAVVVLGIVGLVALSGGGEVTDNRTDAELEQLFTFELGSDGYIVTGYIGDESDVVIPAKYKDRPVVKVGESAFEDRKWVISVHIPGSVTTIGKAAFGYCERLESISLPDSLTNIGRAAFVDCDSLSSIVIPEGVTDIGERMFYSCNRLKSVTIPDSVIGIGERAFSRCQSLNSITIPDSVRYIGGSAFEGSEYTVTVTASHEPYYYDYTADKNVTWIVE
ncbi:MAG: zinc-ribbon domain-containing protein [Ruminococcaceae bacterium]|nr:zinc-ribbon domain-containing protein [Oscillospiraceae bacterium]